MERADLEQWKAKEVARLLALVETERRYYQEIIASAPVGLLVVAQDQRVVSANRAFRETFGLRGDQVLRRKLSEVIPAEGLSAHLEEVLESGSPQSNLFFDLSGASEQDARLLRVAIQRIRSWNDDCDSEALLAVEDFSGIEGFNRVRHDEDAEARKLAGERYTEIGENIDAILWQADALTRRFVFVSPAAERILGFPVRRWLLDQDFWTLRVHPSDRERVSGFYRQAIESGDRHTCEFRALAAENRTVWLREIVRVLRDHDGKAQTLAAVSEDITERRRLEDQLIQAHAFEATSRLANKSVHAVNNLLMVVKGYGEELLNGLSPDDPLRADAQEIVQAGNRAAGFNNELSAFSRRRPPQPAPLEVDAVLEALVEKLRAQSPQLDLDVFLDAAGAEISVDIRQLEQIVAGLAAGAAASPETVAVRIETGVIELGDEYARAGARLKPGRHVVISVRDGGLVLEPEALRQLFEPLSGAGRPAAAELTLPALYSLTRHNGGDISVSSESGCGTTFRICFPRSDKAVESAVEAQEQQQEKERAVTVEALVQPDQIDIPDALAATEVPAAPYDPSAQETAAAAAAAGAEIPVETALPQPEPALEISEPEEAPAAPGLQDSPAPAFAPPLTEASPELLTEGAAVEPVQAPPAADLVQPLQPPAIFTGASANLPAPIMFTETPAVIERQTAPPIEIPRLKTPAVRLPMPDSGTGTIMVVEDQPGVRNLIRKILEKQGYTVIESGNGDDAARIVEDAATHIDLLVTDIVMPKMSGRELADRLRTRHAALKVLFVSGYTDDEFIRKGDLPAGTGFLQKPFALGSLLAKIREMLAEKEE